MESIDVFAPTGTIHSVSNRPTRNAWSNRSLGQLVFGPLVDPQTYLNLVYLVYSFAVGLAFFVTFVVLISVSSSLVVTLVGVPLLILTMYLWCACAQVDVAVSEILLRSGLRMPRFYDPPATLWSWKRLKSRLTCRMTWQSLAYVFARFPQGVAAICVVAFVSWSITLLAGVIVWPIAGGSGPLGDWRIDVVGTGLIVNLITGLVVTLVAIPLVVGSAHLVNLAAWLSVLMTRGMLFEPPAPVYMAVAQPPVASTPEPSPSAETAPVVPLAPAAPPVEPYASALGPDALVVGGVALSELSRSVAVRGVPLEVTPKEFDLLNLFLRNPGRAFSRDELLDRIWSNDYEVTDRTIDTHIQRLRRKLGNEAESIRTVWGVGYKFDPPS